MKFLAMALSMALVLSTAEMASAHPGHHGHHASKHYKASRHHGFCHEGHCHSMNY